MSPWKSGYEGLAKIQDINGADMFPTNLRVNEIPLKMARVLKISP